MLKVKTGAVVWAVIAGAWMCAKLNAAPSDPVTLVKERTPASTIVVGKNLPAAETYAAQELQKYLGRISGAQIPIKEEGEAVSGCKILLGTFASNSAIKALQNQLKEVEGLGEAGFLITTLDGNLVIAGGGTSGVLYGVYTFLENYLGCRWYFPGDAGEVIPKRATIELEAINHSEKPSFSQRGLIENYDQGLLDWLARNKMNTKVVNIDWDVIASAWMSAKLNAGLSDQVTLEVVSNAAAAEPPAGAAGTNAKRPFDYVPPSYPQVEETCPWGVFGSLDSHADDLGVPVEIEAAVAARHWAQFGWDTTNPATAAQVSAPGNPQAEANLGRFLDLHAKYGIRCMPSTFLTEYYDKTVPREKCEEAIRRVVLRFRDHPALLAWWMIDEPLPPVSNLQEWIWGKQQFEALDKKHPTLGATSIPDSIDMYAQYMQIELIDCYALRDGPFTPTAEEPAGVAMWVAEWCEHAWNRGARRIWAIPQAFGEVAWWRLPLPSELRLMTWLYLSRGSTGVLYYQYAPQPAWMAGGGYRGLVDVVGLPTELGEEVLRLAGDVPAICPVLLPLRWTPEARVSVESDKDNKPILDVGRMMGKAYDVVIVSNLDTKAARKGKVRVEQEKDRALYDLRALKPVTVESDGAVALSLQAGDAAVLLSGDANAFAEAEKLILARRLELLKRGAWAAVAEARANGIPAATWDAALSQASVAEELHDYAGAIGATSQAQGMAEAALLADARYSACRQPFDQGTQALSRASRALEVQVLRQTAAKELYGTAHAMKMLQADTVLMTHAETLKELAHCQHLLRYALLTGKTADMAAPCRDLEALAAQAEAGVAAFVANRAEASPNAAALKRLADAVAGVKP